MGAERKPLFLLADSQALFPARADVLLPALQDSLRVAERSVTKAAYIGASNGDAPEFYELFVAAMNCINLHESRSIRSGFGDEDRAFLGSADLLLLAGGDPDLGWEIMKSTGMDAVITDRYYSGAVVMGVSAGAMQLGMGWRGAGDAGFCEGLQLVPYYIGAHGEREDWRELRALVNGREEYAKGFGISTGGALIFHPDLSMEAVRHPVAEFERAGGGGGGVKGNLLLPATRAVAVTPLAGD